MGGTVEPVWEIRREPLQFQFGPFRLGEVSFRALTLLSNPFVLDPDLAVPLSKALAEGCRGIVVPALPACQHFSTICFDRGAVRYTARYGNRYVVDLQGPFEHYLEKFSKKSRGNLRRAVKKFAERNDGKADIQEYRSPSEIVTFRDLAVGISQASYKSDMRLGFQGGESFARQLELEAAAGRVRGYVLMSEGQPVAYVFCRIDHDVIVYKHIGYDERFAQSSPGTVLLYLMLQRLFRGGEFRLLDFDGTEYYAYKEFFATRAINCARVFWFPLRPPEIALFGAHWIITAAWRFASLLRQQIWPRERIWVSARTRLRRTQP
jgi:hypothetical protein